MYTDRFSLPFITGVLIAAAERRRPGLGPWSPQTREALREVFAAELAEVRARFFELFDDKGYWERVERTLWDVGFPRYCALAERQTGLERAEYGLWRGGDLIARGTYALVGLVLGLFVVRAPFIPIPPTWDVLVLLLMLGGPFLPDLQVRLHRRRFEKTVRAIIYDLHAAGEHQRLYQPLQPPPIDAGVQQAAPLLSSHAERSRNGE